MKLTEKDRAFLASLRRLMETRDISVELRTGNPSYMILRGTYGEKIHETFGTTRQGVRWRFQRIFGDAYVSAFETILFIEKLFGPHLRDHAIRISKERYVLHRATRSAEFNPADTLLHNSACQPCDQREDRRQQSSGTVGTRTVPREAQEVKQDGDTSRTQETRV